MALPPTAVWEVRECAFLTDAEVNGTTHQITLTIAHSLGVSGTVNLLFRTVAGTPPTGLVDNTRYDFTIISSTVLELTGITDSGSADFEGRLTVGDDNNGGFFKSDGTGTDYSQQAVAQKAGTDLTMHATTNTKVKPLAAGVADADMDNGIYIASGTGWTPGPYHITAVDTLNGYWTLDRSPAAAGEANTATYKLGGAGGTLAFAVPSHISGNIIYVRGNQSISTAATNVAGGCVNKAGGFQRFVGYKTTRTLLSTDTKPIITLFAGVSSATMLYNANGGFVNLALDGATQTTSRGVSGGLSYRCTFRRFTNNGTITVALWCTATECSTVAGALAGFSYFSEAYANSVTGFSSHSVACISSGNTGATSDGFGGNSPLLVMCVAYGNGRDGLYNTTGGAGIVINCVAENNGRYGYNCANWSALQTVLNFAHYNNTSGNNFGSALQVNIIATSASVFVDAANGNFELNNLPGQGALLRAAGFPSTFPRGLTRNRSDIGAVQHNPALAGLHGGFRI